jgi:UDP-glucuronate decarboxylase
MKLNDYRVIPMFLSRAFLNKYLPVHDKGNQTRTFCYISDAITAIYKVLLMGKSGEVYNIGNDTNEINMVSLANVIAQLFIKKPEVRMVDYPSNYPKDEPRRRSPDLTKIRKGLKYYPKVDLKTGLKRTIKWYKDMNLT